MELLDKLQKWICRTVDPSLAASLDTLAYCQLEDNFIEDNFILEIFLNGCFSKTAAKGKVYLFNNSRLHIFYISYFDVMLKRNKFLWIFFK